MTEMQSLLADEEVVTCESKAFRSEVKEIKDDLGRLNAQISQLSKSMSALVGEKTRLETRVDFLNKQYVKKNNQCVVS